MVRDQETEKAAGILALLYTLGAPSPDFRTWETTNLDQQLFVFHYFGAATMAMEVAAAVEVTCESNLPEVVASKV